MSANFDYAAGVGDFIDSWGDSVTEPYKNVVPILADAKFGEGTIAGGVYHVATRLTYEGGTTFAPPQTQVGEGTSTYVGPRAGQVTDAQLQGMQIHGRSRITYEAVARSAQSVSNYSGADKKKAVQTATKLVADGLMQGTLKKVEALMLHGRSGIGQMDSAVNASNTVGSTVYEGVSGFAVDLSLSPQSWSAAMWAAFEGHTFDIFADTSGLPSGTKVNTATNTLLTGGANQSGLVLIAVNPPTPLTNGTATGRVIRLWSTSGTAGAVGTGVVGGWTPAAAGVNHVCFESGGPTNEFVGLDLMAQNTGTLFNINAANYGMWRGNNLPNVGNLRLAQLIRAISATILNFGGQGATIRSIVPTELFAQFANDESTLRRYSSATGDAENGFDSIQMFLPHKSRLEILGHALQKDGLVLNYIPDECVRVGAAELDFINRSASNGRSRKEQFLLEVQDRPASEMRLYGQFAPIVATPRHLLRMSGVTF